MTRCKGYPGSARLHIYKERAASAARSTCEQATTALGPGSPCRLRPGTGGTQQLDERGRRHCGAHQKALYRIAAFGPQELQLGGCLNALGDDLQIQVMTERDDGADDRGVVRVGADVVDERAVDLQRVQREAFQIVQRAVPGAEVIYRERKPEFLQRQQ